MKTPHLVQGANLAFLVGFSRLILGLGAVVGSKNGRGHNGAPFKVLCL